jgi:hypothetical protein
MEYKPTETQWRFMNDNSFVRLIAGPVGSGKSICCVHEILKRSLQQAPNEKGERKTRTLIVRNTADQLRSTTHKSLMDWISDLGIWKASERTFYINQQMDDGTIVKAELMEIALDTPDDVRKALSLEASFCWMNEARELHSDVVNGLLMRLRRYPSMKDGGPTWSGAVLDTNFPDQDVWMFNQMETPPSNWKVFIQPPAILSRDEWVNLYGEDPDTDPVIDDREVEWWVNPKADNLQYLDPNYYPDIVPSKTEDFLSVYLRCRYGRSLSGLPVYDRTFNDEVHVAKTPFIPLKAAEYPIVIGLDFGRTPAATLIQRNVYGQAVVLAELTSENTGIETFLETKLQPLLAQTRFLGCSYIVAPDPAGWAKQQIGEISPVDVVKRAGYKVAKPASNIPDRRIMSVERLLTANVGGKPTFQVNPECVQLIKGFKFGYRYKLNKAGQQDQTPDKNSFSHVHDACQYGCMIIEGNQLTGAYPGQTQRRDIKKVSYLYA